MSFRRIVGLASALLLACGGEDGASETAGVTDDVSFSCEEGEGDALYEQRIAPLLATDRPSSCNTCHLSGVDLGLFVQETPCQTMACLEHRSLVDLERPEQSTILQWIARASPDSELITDAVIAEEYEGFLAWIEQTASCGGCVGLVDPCGDQSTQESCAGDNPGSSDSFDDPGDCSPRTREALFRHRVYAWRDRCYPCHFDNKDNDGPDWIATGACELASLQTMHSVLERGYVDLDDPESSLLLRKPLAEDAGGLEHGGHDKFESTSDSAYLDFKTWIDREASCRQ